MLCIEYSIVRNLLPDFLPPLKNLSFTKPPSLKESLKTPLNFKETKDLP